MFLCRHNFLSPYKKPSSNNFTKNKPSCAVWQGSFCISPDIQYDFEISLDGGVVDFVYNKIGEAYGFSPFRLERFPVFWNAPKDTKQHRIISAAGLVWLGITNFAFQLDFGFVDSQDGQIPFLPTRFKITRVQQVP
jgi:hypothetical protein